MKILGKSLAWQIIETDQFKPLHDFGKEEVKVLKIHLTENAFGFVVKINERAEGKAWLGPGVFISTNPEIGVSETEVERCFYMRPKLTSIKGDHVGALEAERIVQWLYSKRFKFIESLHYNFPKGNKV